MKRFFRTRWFVMSAGLVLCVLALLAVAWHFRIWSWRDLRVYQGMSQECHPVWRELHWGRIHSGQDVEEVVAITKPVRVDRYGDFVELSYQQGICFTGVTIMARRGRLTSAAAWSCTWNRTFFDESTPEDAVGYREAVEAHWRQIQHQQ